MKKVEYIGRGIHNIAFLNALKLGKLKPMMDVIKNIPQLDVQIRNNYLNIYYEGGSIAKVSSENSVKFDEKYFYTNMKNTPAKDISQEIKDKLKSQRDELVIKFKEGNFEEYFSEAKQVMDKWFEVKPNPERWEQHQLSIKNCGKSDYTIIDLEYQVSTLSKFSCDLIGDNGKPRIPRFDIIAVNKAGELCVIELKKGSGALKGTSGMKEHYKCYEHSIGRMHEPFVQEMKKLLKQKKDLNLIDTEVKITSSKPKFMFAYSYATINNEGEDEIFDREYQEIEGCIHFIKLKKGSWKLLDEQN
ncbi:MAG: hypothetical protein WDZ80_03510 [Candidatus Paceibacterota bacterium]